jgi:hypothetical protein
VARRGTALPQRNGLDGEFTIRVGVGVIQSELETRLADVVRSKWGENGIEYLVGAIASITTEQQLEVLIEANR